WTFGGAGSGPNIARLHDLINAAMTANGSPYQLTVADLSGWTNFAEPQVVRYDFAGGTLDGWDAYGGDGPAQWSVINEGGHNLVHYTAIPGGDGPARLQFTALGDGADQDITARLRAV